jgi:16S rRNA (cytosine1402-N4)-methyltransferase
MHIPVLLNEVIDQLDPKLGETAIDGTLGNGGHAKAIGERLGRTGTLIGIDQDEASLDRATAKLAALSCRQILVKGNFRRMGDIAAAAGVKEANLVLLDLGFSSEQLLSGRGFSFQSDEPLDMRMSETEAKFTAGEIVNDWSESTLADIIYGYGEETFARRIARQILSARAEGRIETTGQLVAVIRQAVPGWYAGRRLHFATKTFQALRIAVNDELGALKEGLAGAWSLLTTGGRLGVISFHSLEARIVKDFAKAKKAAGAGRERGVLKPARAEVLANPRARSAQLRVLIKN